VHFILLVEIAMLRNCIRERASFNPLYKYLVLTTEWHFLSICSSQFVLQICNMLHPNSDSHRIYGVTSKAFKKPCSDPFMKEILVLHFIYNALLHVIQLILEIVAVVVSPKLEL